MWDDSMMRDSGYTDLAKDREDKPRAETGPATTKDFGGEDNAKVKVGSAPSAAAPKPAPASPSVVSWIITLVIAIGIGVAVFFVVRLIRG